MSDCVYKLDHPTVLLDLFDAQNSKKVPCFALNDIIYVTEMILFVDVGSVIYILMDNPFHIQNVKYSLIRYIW